MNRELGLLHRNSTTQVNARLNRIYIYYISWLTLTMYIYTIYIYDTCTQLERTDDVLRRNATMFRLKITVLTCRKQFGVTYVCCRLRGGTPPPPLTVSIISILTKSIIVYFKDISKIRVKEQLWDDDGSTICSIAGCSGFTPSGTSGRTP